MFVFGFFREKKNCEIVFEKILKRLKTKNVETVIYLLDLILFLLKSVEEAKEQISTRKFLKYLEFLIENPRRKKFKKMKKKLSSMYI